MFLWINPVFIILQQKGYCSASPSTCWRVYIPPYLVWPGGQNVSCSPNLHADRIRTGFRAHNISNWVRMRPTRCNKGDLLLISSISTCFGHLYAHRQEIQLRSTAYSCLSCCSCCARGRQHSPHSAHILPTDSPASQQLQQDRQL